MLAGSFTLGRRSASLAHSRWNGTVSEPLGAGLKGTVYAIKIIGGELPGGTFSIANPAPAYGFANGMAPIGFLLVDSIMEPYTILRNIREKSTFAVIWRLGMQTLTGHCHGGMVANGKMLAVDSLGDIRDTQKYDLVESGKYLHAAGIFFNAGNSPIQFLARWDGSIWSPVGNGLDSVPVSLAADGSTVYVGGSFHKAGEISSKFFARWHGLVFQYLPIALR
jgi:hypothetical protein